MFDVIGDVHGCYQELLILIEQLGYEERNGYYTHPQERKLVFLGDLMDRGPESLRVIRLVAQLVQQEKALYVPGNHCDKLYRLFLGRNVQITHGLETTVAELARTSKHEKEAIKAEFISLYEQAPYYLVLDEGKLIVSHAGITEKLIGQHNNKVKRFCLYGDITGEKDEAGFPIRRDWAKEYTGHSWIIYGHTPVRQPRYVNHTVNIDTGCVFGGYLTAFRYPEMKVEMVPSSLDLIAERFRVE